MDVLVTAATGRLGGPLTARLLAGGHRVRALTRSPGSAAASALSERGAELVQGDLDDPDTLRRVVRGADAVFLATTPHHGIGPVVETQRAVAVIRAATEADVGYLVYSSAAGADQPADVPILQSKRHVEDQLRAVPLLHAVLAPVYFMENLHYPWNDALLRAGRWPIPLPPDRAVQLVSVLDLAAVAAQVIEQPAGFAGQRIEVAADELTGPQAAQVMTAVLGRPIAHAEAVPPSLTAMAPLFGWIADTGFHADIPRLHDRFPQVAWRGLADWAAGQDWDTGNITAAG